MATKRTNKYVDYRYEIKTPEEFREAQWLIAQGFFTDMEDYIDRSTRMELRHKKRTDTGKLKLPGAQKQDKAA